MAANGISDSEARTQNGYFTNQNGCVVFQLANSAATMTPIFPQGETALVTDGHEWLGLYVKGSAVGMHKVYRLRGGRPHAGDGVALAAPVPSGCPANYFVVHSVGHAVAEATRYCTSVTLCRSFGLD